jgi:16S rRNA (cytidine1402-2'-O)-methyltransferase
MVFFESATRITATLEAMTEVFGAERDAAVCRELTKKFEEVKHGTVSELAAWSALGVKGEIALVVGGAAAQQGSREDALELVRAAVASGTRLKDAARDVASLTGLSARDLYQDALDAKPR